MKISLSTLVFFLTRKLNKLFKTRSFTLLLTVVLSLNAGAAAFAQSIKISGKVTDEATKEAIIGATVTVSGAKGGTITDINGNYTISVPDRSATLEFSYIGYVKASSAVGANTTIDIALVSDIKNLDEIVVIGYGSSKKSDISGSVASVSKDEMMKKSPTNVLDGLKGMAAGVSVTSQDGAPDGNATIRIRGVATIQGSALPLYVVDGVQVGNNANFLNPSDIESMEILKDASATAIYGAAGANGVIMITTKHGAVGAARITVTADFGMQTLGSKLDVGDADQYAYNIRTARANDGTKLQNQIYDAKYDGKRQYIDWQDVMTHTSFKKQYTISATGGNEKTQSSFSLGYLDNDGVIINTNYNRITAHANVVTKVNDYVEFGGDMNYTHSEAHGSNASFGNNGNLSSLRDIAFMSPTMDYIDANTGALVSPNVKNANGTYGQPMQSSLGQYDGLIAENIYASQRENNGLSKNNSILTSAYVNIKLFKGLAFKSVASYKFETGDYNNFSGNKQRYMPDGVTKVSLTNYDAREILDISGNQNNTKAIESYLTYNWSNDIHNLTVMAGNSVSAYNGDEVSAQSRDFPASTIRDISLTSDPTTRTGNGKYRTQVKGLSYFGRLSYSLKNRYIATATIRRDGSSNFGVDNRFGTFPSAALAWRISEEDFMKDISEISNLKLRLGWGQTGNSGGATDKSVAALSSQNAQYNFYGQGGAAGIGSSKQLVNGYYTPLVDTRLKWETNEQTNIGIDLGLFQNTVNLTVDYFTRKSSDLLLDRSIRPSAGFTSVYTNYGDIENKGVEFMLSYKKQLNSDWNVGATLTGATLKNKVVKMGADLLSMNDGSTYDGSNQGQIAAAGGVHWAGHSICREGYAVGSFYGYQVAGIFQSKEEVDAANAPAIAKGHSDGYQFPKTQAGDFKYVDQNEDGYIDDKDKVILGNGFPKVNYGLTLNASYKNWDISVYTYGVYGAKIFSYSAMTLSTMISTDNATVPNILNSASAEAWTPQNHSTTIPRLSLLDPNYNVAASSAWVKNGDFFKIGTIQIGYSLDKNLVKSVGLEGLRLTASVNNVACFSSYNKYGDPEAGQGSVLFTGLDTGRYPIPRTYSFGLNVQF